MNSTLG